MQVKFFWFNVIGYNVAWLGLILLGNTFIPAAILWLTLHLLFCTSKKQEVYVIASITCAGIVIDTLLLQMRVFDFGSNSVFIPFWLITLWACFAATIKHSLAFLQKHMVLPILVGGICVPFSYFAGEKLGAVNFPKDAVLTFIVLSLTWILLLSVIVSLLKKDNFSYA